MLNITTFVPRSWRQLATTLAGIAVFCGCLVGQATGAHTVPSSAFMMTAAIGVTFTPMAALVLIGSPGHLVGRLMAMSGVLAAIDVLAASWSTWLPLSWLSRWMWWPSLGLIIQSLLVFPDGRLLSRRWRPVAVISSAAIAVASATLAVAAYDHPKTLFTTVDLQLTVRAHACIVVSKVAVLLAAVGLVAALWSLTQRWRRASGDTRRQLACLLPAAVLFLLALILDAIGVEDVWLVVAVVVPVAMTIAVLRFHLYNLDQIINRSVVWLLMTLFFVVVYTILTSRFSDAIIGGHTSAVPMAVTGAVGVVFEPVRRYVQQNVNRLLYGESSDPYKVIAHLGDLLRQTAEPCLALSRLAEVIAGALLVPYVAVEVASARGSRLATAHGAMTSRVEVFEMTAHGEYIGRLLVAPRSATDQFSRRERRLLHNVAVHAAVAAKTIRLIQDLQRSRERLVMAREEERRRIRHDLHDGVGPALAGLSMQLRAARKMAINQTSAETVLRACDDDLRVCMDEIRRIVDHLRPAALDNGLVTALRSECRRFDNENLRVELNVDDGLDKLAPATEVALFRIVAESLTNVARHAEAKTCIVTVRLPPAGTRPPRVLDLEIADDGKGATPSTRHHVGLASMRERAEELGGDFTIGDRIPNGTVVRVHLPVVLPAEDRLITPRQATRMQATQK